MTPRDDFSAVDVGLAVLGALDPNDELTREELDVRAWRFEQLVAARYEIEDAMKIACADHVELEIARSLTMKHGCPPELAARILL